MTAQEFTDYMQARTDGADVLAEVQKLGFSSDFIAAHVLTGNFWLLQILGAVMTVYGLYVLYLMLRRPEDLAVEENHVSWAHMYRMMFVAQIGFALAYLL